MNICGNCNFFISFKFSSRMDVSDITLFNNRDWDPSYLAGIFSEDFYEFKDLWNNSNVNDVELVQASQAVENVENTNQ